MSKDPHKLIQDQATHDGWPEGEYVSPEAFSMFQQVKSIFQSPQERAQQLRALDEIIGMEDGTSLRSKAELLNVRRSLSHTHRGLLKAGR